MRISPYLWIIIGLFSVFVTWSINITPYRQPGVMAFQRGADGQPAKIADIGNPDERQHANYIAYLIKEKSLPVLSKETATEMYQAHQAPLYYMIATILGDPTTEGGQRTRYLSLIFGIGSIFAMYLFGVKATGREEIGLASAAFCLLPGFTMLHGAISNDPLLIFFCSATLAGIGWMLKDGKSVKGLIALGCCVGLGILTKSSGLVLIPVLLAALFLMRTQETKISPFFAIVPAFLLPVPFFLRNVQVYGDPLAQNVFREVFTGNPFASMFIQSYGVGGYWSQWVAWWTSRSFVGAFGYMDIFYPVNLYRIAFAFLFLCLVGWLISARNKEEGPQKPFSLSAGTLVLFAFLLFIQFNLVYFQGQARYLMPAAAGIFFFLGFGLQGWFGKEKPYGWIVAVGLLSGLQVYTLSTMLPAEFQKRTALLDRSPIYRVANVFQLDIPATFITNQRN